MTTHRPTDEATVAMLKADPSFAVSYLTVALEEAGKQGGKAALLTALRNVATAHDLELNPATPQGPGEAETLQNMGARFVEAWHRAESSTSNPGPEPEEKPAA
jgi:hypothetical protein